jgi:hypothetical protein
MGKKKKNKMYKYNITIRGYFSRHYVYTVGIMLPTENKIKKEERYWAKIYIDIYYRLL